MGVRLGGGLVDADDVKREVGFGLGIEGGGW